MRLGFVVDPLVPILTGVLAMEVKRCISNYMALVHTLQVLKKFLMDKIRKAKDVMVCAEMPLHVIRLSYSDMMTEELLEKIDKAIAEIDNFILEIDKEKHDEI